MNGSDGAGEKEKENASEEVTPHGKFKINRHERTLMWVDSISPPCIQCAAMSLVTAAMELPLSLSVHSSVNLST